MDKSYKQWSDGADALRKLEPHTELANELGIAIQKILALELNENQLSDDVVIHWHFDLHKFTHSIGNATYAGDGSDTVAYILKSGDYDPDSEFCFANDKDIEDEEYRPLNPNASEDIAEYYLECNEDAINEAQTELLEEIANH